MFTKYVLPNITICTGCAHSPTLYAVVNIMYNNLKHECSRGKILSALRPWQPPFEMVLVRGGILSKIAFKLV